MDTNTTNTDGQDVVVPTEDVTVEAPVAPVEETVEAVPAETQTEEAPVTE